MKKMIIAALALFTMLSFANTEQRDVESDAYTEELISSRISFSNPPGSYWATVRCAERSTCLPPAGYKFRHFNTEIKGSDCKRRRVKTTKDYIKTPSNCSVRGRVFLWPAAYCTGNYRFCS